jgi:hypothetical protein
VGYDDELLGEWFLRVPKDRTAFIVKGKAAPEDSATLRNVGRHLQYDTASHSRMPEPQQHRSEKVKCANKLRLFRDSPKPLGTVSRENEYFLAQRQ